MEILVPISIGELYDKITILQIKKEFIENEDKLLNIHKELDLLLFISKKNPIEEDLRVSLLITNLKIWDIEDNIRIEEKNEDWGDNFIKLARSVYINNDKRAEIKRQINIKYGSNIIEEKSYEEY